MRRGATGAVDCRGPGAGGAGTAAGRGGPAWCDGRAIPRSLVGPPWTRRSCAPAPTYFGSGPSRCRHRNSPASDAQIAKALVRQLCGFAPWRTLSSLGADAAWRDEMKDCDGDRQQINVAARRHSGHGGPVAAFRRRALVRAPACLATEASTIRHRRLAALLGDRPPEMRSSRCWNTGSNASLWTTGARRSSVLSIAPLGQHCDSEPRGRLPVRDRGGAGSASARVGARLRLFVREARPGGAPRVVERGCCGGLAACSPGFVLCGVVAQGWGASG